MTLVIEHPPSFSAERNYIMDVLFGDFLGLTYRAIEAPRENVRISRGDSSAGELLLEDVLFGTPVDKWMQPDSLPNRPLPRWDVSSLAGLPIEDSEPIPVILGRELEQGWHFLTEEKVHLGLDITGSAFFMLSRYEERTVDERDAHARFPATASLAWSEQFLDRPIIDEYVELLWWSLQRLWPDLKRRPRNFQVRLSHDVDRPFQFVRAGLVSVFSSTVMQAVRKRKPRAAFEGLANYWAVVRGKTERDGFNTFPWIMDLSEKHGLTSAFYFIDGRRDDKTDPRYELREPEIQELIRRIGQRGHEVGFHPSYDTFRSPEKTKSEFEHLKDVCQRLGVEQEQWGGRQHYLRWENPVTWQNWESAGLDYDSTLGFADVAGFRCGTCFEYPVFNLETRAKLNLRERPLIAMDVSLLKYSGLAWEDIAETVHDLCDKCRRIQGMFTLLWHNSTLATAEEKRWYGNIVEDIAGAR